MNQGYNSVISKICLATGLQLSEVELRINRKLAELNDLISKEGAAHIIANELKVKLFDTEPKTLKITDIQAGMSAITIYAKVLQLFETRTFQSKNRQGRVASMTIADETGSIRLAIWDEGIIEQMKNVKQNDIIKIANAYSKQNNNFKELHLGSRAQLVINPEGIVIDEVRETKPEIKRKLLNEIQDNEIAEAFATIVQVFEPRHYYACPFCNKKVTQAGEVFICAEHNNVPPKQLPILNMFIDDGTMSIRAVCFREQAEAFIKQNNGDFEQLKKSLLGQQLLIKGRMVRNEMFNRQEFTISSISEPHPEALMKELENAV